MGGFLLELAVLFVSTTVASACLFFGDGPRFMSQPGFIRPALGATALFGVVSLFPYSRCSLALTTAGPVDRRYLWWKDFTSYEAPPLVVGVPAAVWLGLVLAQFLLVGCIKSHFDRRGVASCES